MKKLSLLLLLPFLMLSACSSNNDDDKELFELVNTKWVMIDDDNLYYSIIFIEDNYCHYYKGYLGEYEHQNSFKYSRNNDIIELNSIHDDVKSKGFFKENLLYLNLINIDTPFKKE